MKLFSALALVAALVASSATALDAGVKQRYHVNVPKVIFDAAREAFGAELDIWHAEADGSNVKADIYATEATINKFYATPNAKTLRTREGAPLLQIEPHPVNTQEWLATRVAAAATCTKATRRHLEQTAATKYTDNAFFDCWRTADEIYAFFDQLVSENPTVFSKIDAISKSVEGRPIPAYKLSTGSGKKAIYMQALIHAREWGSGASTFYTMASLLDALREKNTTITPVVDKYDWYFVPIVNIDGFLFTHSLTGDRLWRKNRRPTIGYQGKPDFGIDLNRNFGPLEYFNKANDPVWSLTYSGPSPLSEPETAGIFAFLKTLPLAGALDMHMFDYSGLVLRPYGNRLSEAPAPYGPKLKAMGDRVKDATIKGTLYQYKSQTSSALYLSYGSFIDSVFSELKNVPALSYEGEGEDFVEPERIIRPAAKLIFNGVVQYAKELETYWNGL